MPSRRGAKQGEAAKQGDAPKPAKAAKASKAAKRPSSRPAVLTQTGAPQLTAEQIVANSDANIERIKKELNLTPEQEKNWAGFNSAMHYLGHNGADRLNLRIARAKRDPPDDIIEQMRNEAQFLNDRAVDQRNVADAAEPLFASLDDKQKAVFIEEMVASSHERGLRLSSDAATLADANSRARMPWGRLKARHPAILPQRRGASNSSCNVEETRTDSRPSDGRLAALSGTQLLRASVAPQHHSQRTSAQGP